MPHEVHPRVIHGVELLVWLVLVGLTLVTLASTYGATFPARERALMGEVGVLSVALALTGLSLWRLRQRPRAKTVLSVARLVVGVPLLLFALLVAAAGFSA